MITSLEEAEQDGGDGAHTAAEHQTSGATLQGVDCAFHRLLRLVRQPGVHRPALKPTSQFSSVQFSSVQCCFTSTETIRTNLPLTTASPGRPPQSTFTQLLSSETCPTLVCMCVTCLYVYVCMYVCMYVYLCVRACVRVRVCATKILF